MFDDNWELKDVIQEEQVRKEPRGFWIDKWGVYVQLGTGIRFRDLPSLH